MYIAMQYPACFFALLFLGVSFTSSLPSGPVVIYDKGLGMPICTYEVPAGWEVNQHIVTNYANPGDIFQAYHLEFLGPEGEIFLGLKPVTIVSMMGQNLGNVWQQQLSQSLSQNMQRVQLGPIQRSQTALEVFDAGQYGNMAQGLERAISGTLNGRPMEGVTFVLQLGDQWASIMACIVVLCPKGNLTRTMAIYRKINSSRIDNPQYIQRTQQLLAITQQNQQYQFNQHQANMRAQSQAWDERNAAWLRDFNSSSPDGSSGSSYNSHDSFIDYLRGTTTFDDPYSGYQIQQDGQYDYWYTDGLGNYHGTNDPGFNPASLDGDWQAITPRGTGGN